MRTGEGISKETTDQYVINVKEVAGDDHGALLPLHNDASTISLPNCFCHSRAAAEMGVGDCYERREAEQ